MSTTIDDNFEEGVAVPGRYPGSPPIGVLPYYCFRHRRDQEGFTGRVQGHSTGITASRSSEVYEWLLAQPPLRGLTLAVRHARDS